MPFRIFMVTLLISTAVVAIATPREDLASSSQEVRDLAARELRASFVAPPRSKWDFLVAAIKPGDTRQSVMELLRPYNVTPEAGVASGQTFTESHRLDDIWVLSCSYRRSGAAEAVIEATLRENLLHIWVAPVPTFSGVLQLAPGHTTTKTARYDRPQNIRSQTSEIVRIFKNTITPIADRFWSLVAGHWSLHLHGYAESSSGIFLDRINRIFRMTRITPTRLREPFSEIL
jgi:hypothetical protein